MWKNKQYFKFIKILRVVCSSIVILLIVFSNVLYYNVKKNMLSNQFNSNEKIYNSFVNQLERINGIAKEICVGQFYNDDNQSIMLAKNMDYERLYVALSNFQSVIAANEGVVSATIYNHSMNKYYGVANGAIEISNEFDNILKFYESVPKLTPIPRFVPRYDQKSEAKVISYAMYENVNEKNLPKGGILLNYDFNWLFDTIKKYTSSDLKIIVMDNNNIIVDSSDSNIFIKKANDELIDIVKDTNTYESIIKKYNNNRAVISRFESDMDWQFIFIQDYDSFFGDIDFVRQQIIFITLFFIIVAIIMSILLTQRIYSPFKKIASLIADKKFANQSENDDVAELFTGYVSSSNKTINEYEKRLLNFKEEEHIKRLLLYGKNSDVPINVIGNVIFFVFSENPENKFSTVYFSYLFDMIKGYMTMMNIVKYKILVISKTQVVIIADEIYDKLLEAIRAIMYDAALCDISISASISKKAQTTENIYEKYNICKNLIKYRMLLGDKCLITEDDVCKLDKKEFSYHKSKEKALLECVVNFELEEKEVFSCVKEFIDYLAENNNYDSFCLGVNRLLLSIQNKIFVYNSGNIAPIAIELDQYNLILAQKETKGEIITLFVELISKINNDGRMTVQNKNDSIAYRINSYINENYSNLMLCADKIAQDFHISKSRISQVYKKETGITITDMILKVRMEKVAELLLNTEFSIKKIMMLCGFENESNFYKLFKKYFSVTPRQYRENYLEIKKI